MTYAKAIEVITRYQEWRKGDIDNSMIHPKVVTQALGMIINSYGKLSAEVFESSGQWWFRIKSNNHEIVAPSEGYKSKTGAIKTAKLFNIPITIK